MNLHSEDQAKRQHCCGPEGTGNFIRDGRDQPRRWCMASGCMAWRWEHEKEPLTEKQLRSAGMAIGLAAALQPDRDPQRGYCGLAGQP